MGAPWVSKAIPSAWKPGLRSLNPRSITASTLVPAHSAGTLPEIRNHVVDQGAPHGAPVSAGTYEAAKASAAGTGEPHGNIEISHGSRLAQTRGMRRTSRARCNRASVLSWSWCIDNLRLTLYCAGKRERAS